MSERPQPKSFGSPEAEIAYLRAEIAKRERTMMERQGNGDTADYETLGKAALREYGEHEPSAVLPEDRRLSPALTVGLAEQVSVARNKVEEVIHLAEDYGIRNALSVLERTRNSFIIDEAHRALVAHIRTGKHVANFKDGAPEWNILHMTLFSVSLPESPDEKEEAQELTAIISAMEQLFAGLQTIGKGDRKQHFHYSLEIAVSDKSDDIVFYMAVPTQYIDLFEKQLLSLFPHAVLTEEKNDYNIFSEGGISLVSVAKLKKFPIYPIRTYDTFDHDPLRVLLNAFSKIEREGGGASLQILVRPRPFDYQKKYEDIIKKVRKGTSVDKAIEQSTMFGSVLHFVQDELFSSKKKEEEKEKHDIPQEKLELFQKKIERPIHEVVIRIAISAKEEARAQQLVHEIEAAFNQFEHTMGNSISFSTLKGRTSTRELQRFSFREFADEYALPLSEREIATLIHIPRGSNELAPQFKQVQAKTAPAPIVMPQQGTRIGKNSHRGKETDIYISPQDRLRHFYVVGQTGTGKSVLLKNMVIDDMKNGAGVCFIDPHGTDIADVLAAVPPEREKDIIYFDPAHTEHVLGLNMLEYDPQFPEQKTFVVNELFSIFQKLYGAVPESMGPIFEQYFRNATMLVLDDPQSGSTLLDVSRVMADAEFRRLKLSKATNPVVIQFWKEIATKAGGDAALENMVPYITSKFDIFTANDFMRPIIGQQTSAFNMREVMDSKKILLVNLSKGRLGEINANLIGMIIVGKILMAALSRVDDRSGDYAPFYLHIDEFQNITTNSIASILSEARKYKLGLTIAHQFIAQIDEKIRDAVFGNVGSICAFRVGSADAEFLEKQFAPEFKAHDLMHIENRHAYVRMLVEGVPAKPFSIATFPPVVGDAHRIEALMNASYVRYGKERAAIENDIQARYQR